MHRFVCCLCIVLVGVWAASGQTPEIEAPLQQFDRNLLRIKRERTQWQLWAGNLLIKDFGPSEADAREALQVLRDLRVSSRGSIGGVFEYYLADGEAPTAPTKNKLVIPFDPSSLRVEEQKGRWLLRDRANILYDFGSSQADAAQALSVCQQYGFNQIGVIGKPTPALRFLFRSTGSLLAERHGRQVVQASANVPKLDPPNPQLKLPGTAGIGEVIPFDARRLDVRREFGDWNICLNSRPIYSFGPRELEARAAVQALQQFRCTDLCRIGPEFAFFLSNGHAPQGSALGLTSRALKADALNVRKLGGTWAICEDRRTLFQFGENEARAQAALSAIRHFQFDGVIAIRDGAYLLVRSR